MRAVNAEVILTPGMTAEHACRVLKKKMLTLGLFREMKQRDFYTPPGKARRLKSLRARKRERKQKHHWTYERLVYLDRLGLADDKPGPRW